MTFGLRPIFTVQHKSCGALIMITVRLVLSHFIVLDTTNMRGARLHLFMTTMMFSLCKRRLPGAKYGGTARGHLLQATSNKAIHRTLCGPP